jgi:Reverse transcriptase (RNA-dependent DNA polymerase)
MVCVTIDYFNSNGSTVYLASLDIKKEFNSFVHDKLFALLENAGLPVPVIDIIRNWYIKLTVYVRWGNCLSDIFAVLSGTRQDSVISPTLFNFFVNLFIVQLRESNISCVVRSPYSGCLLYADDMIILCPSIKGSQCMSDNGADALSLPFIAFKSMCLAIGKLVKLPFHSMSLGSRQTEWVNSIKYLDVIGGKSLRFDSNIVKQNAFAAYNCVYAHANHPVDIRHISLQESYCLPISSHMHLLP